MACQAWPMLILCYVEFKLLMFDFTLYFLTSNSPVYLDKNKFTACSSVLFDACDVIIPWPDMTWSISFFQRMRKGLLFSFYFGFVYLRRLVSWLLDDLCSKMAENRVFPIDLHVKQFFRLGRGFFGRYKKMSSVKVASFDKGKKIGGAQFQDFDFGILWI